VQAPLGAVPRLALGLLAETEHLRQMSCPRRGSLLILNVALSMAGDAVGPDPRHGGLAQAEPPGQRRVVQCAPLSAGVSWQVTRVPAATVPSVSGGVPLPPPTTRRWLALLPVRRVVRAGRPRRVFVLFGGRRFGCSRTVARLRSGWECRRMQRGRRGPRRPQHTALAGAPVPARGRPGGSAHGVRPRARSGRRPSAPQAATCV